MAKGNPKADELRALLERTRTIALIGASPDPARPAHYVMRYLLDVGYEVIPIRPGGGEVHGIPTVASLRDLPAVPDLVDVFRAIEHVPAIVEEAIGLGAPAIWLQDGVIHEEAARRAREAGLSVVQDDCILRVHQRLLGGR